MQVINATGYTTMAAWIGDKNSKEKKKKLNSWFFFPQLKENTFKALLLLGYFIMMQFKTDEL